jgi:predicted RecB family nuclease
LYPHARNADDAPWRAAKREIATTVAELTLLPAMNPERRASAHAAGISRWTDAAATASSLGVTSTTYATRLDAVLAANRANPGSVLPSRISTEGWRKGAALEFYVDFETVSNLDDDFSQLPAVGGTPLIVQIGCGHLRENGEWKFAQWTVDSLRPGAEREIIEAWLAHMAETCASAAAQLPSARIFHWSAAEPVSLETAYTSARTRHPAAQWPSPLPWFDFLERVVRAEPVTVTGAFNFGLKAIAKAMHTLGLISTIWSDGPTDGLGAMVGIWSAAHEATATGTSLSDHPLMREIARYNEVDCRAMCQVIRWLRQNR